jgi:alkylation response protein AidB-like acyl-CoA dehydrogenase
MQELNEIRALARDFAGAELRPNTEAWDHEGALPPSVREQLAELGFLGMRVPEAQGGMGFDAPTFIAALEELAWGEPSAALTVAIAAIAAEAIVTHGTDEQQTEWLNAIAAGEQVPTLSLLGTSALRAADAGDGARLAGELAWIAEPKAATVAIVALESGDGVAGGWIVPVESAGITLGEPRATMGLRPLALADATFDGVEAGATGRLGGEPFGGGVGTFARLAVAAIAVGIAESAVGHALEYASVREQFGQPIRDFEGIASKLAEMRVRTDAARALLGSAASAYESRSGGEAAAEAAADVAALGARIFAADTAMWVTTQAVQVFGGYGYMRDYPVEKLMRDARAAALLLGENDALRGEVARALYNG